MIAFRNRAIEEHRAGAVTRHALDRANSLVSLAYGAEFPLSGLHGDLAGNLELRQQGKTPLDASDPVVACTKLVAGAHNTDSVRSRHR